MSKDDPVLTAADMTPAEQAAWEVAVNRGMNISRLDLRLLLQAALTFPHVYAPQEEHK